MKSIFPYIVVGVIALGAGTGLGWVLSSAGEGRQAEAGVAAGPGVAANAADTTELEALRIQVAAYRKDLERRQEEIDALMAQLARVEQESSELAGEVDQLNREWLFSYGSTREAGKFVGSLMSDALAMRDMDPDDPEMLVMARDMFLKFASLGPILQEMQNLDDNPQEFAAFRASMLGEAIGLDEAGQRRVEGIVERYKGQALELERGSEERLALNELAAEEIRAGLDEEQAALLEGIPGTRMGMLNDLLETPSLDPQQWRERQR